MTTTTDPGPTTPVPLDDRYALGRTRQEYERLRAQARVWQLATSRVLDAVGVLPGARCLDAGAGPGEVMRLLAERAGPDGQVLGIDVDVDLLALAQAALHAAGHRQASVRAHDLTAPGAVPEGPFDVVYARLLLFHLPERTEVLARLWDAVAPGGVLVVHEYDIRAVNTLPELPVAEEIRRIITDAFAVAGADSSIGSRLPLLFESAGMGQPDGTDVAGRLEPLATGHVIMSSTARSLLPVAVAGGVITAEAAGEVFAELDRAVRVHPGHQVLWPLLIAAWKRKA